MQDALLPAIFMLPSLSLPLQRKSSDQTKGWPKTSRLRPGLPCCGTSFPSARQPASGCVSEVASRAGNHESTISPDCHLPLFVRCLFQSGLCQAYLFCHSSFSSDDSEENRNHIPAAMPMPRSLRSYGEAPFLYDGTRQPRCPK